MSQRYREAGVDLDAADRAMDLIRGSVRSTFGPEVLTDVGAFGAVFSLARFREPLLVSSADGVGTKLRVALALKRHRSIGIDLVNHCVNDVLTTGAEPLFFLDYFGTGRLDPEVLAEIVQGLAEACRETGCALVGGETAELPDLYAPGDYDLAGFIVGGVERDEVIRGEDVSEGDDVWVLPASGLHTNGYSLVRKLFPEDEYGAHADRLGRTLGEELLIPHRSYLDAYRRLKRAGVRPRAMAHITGGGLPGNVERVIPRGLAAEIRWGAWPVNEIFHLIQERAGMERDEMARVFNCGAGYVIIAEPADAGALGQAIPEAVRAGRVAQAAAEGGRVRLLADGS